MKRIALQDGCSAHCEFKTYYMSRGLRNFNPGNIRNSPTKYEGEIENATDCALKRFASMPFGYRAVFMLLYTYQKRYGLNTIREMITRYAPPSENHTDEYVKAVAIWAGLDPDREIRATCRDVMLPIVAAMSRVENGVKAVMADVEAGWELFIKSVRR